MYGSGFDSLCYILSMYGMTPVIWGEGSGLAPSMDQLTLLLYSISATSPPPGHFSSCIGSLPPPHITLSFANIVPGNPYLT